MMVIHGEYFTIQKIDRKYINQVYGIYKKCEDFLSLGPVSVASKQMVLDDFKISENECGIYCGIFIHGIMIGIVDFVLSGFEGNPSHAYISLLMISIDYRSKGIGKDVVKAIEKEILKNITIKAILAGVQTNNKNAIKFWENNGYKIVSVPQVMADMTIIFRLQKDIF